MHDLGLTVLGQAQVDFSIGDKTGCTLGEVVLLSTFRRMTAIEDELTAINVAAKLRMKKLQDVGAATAIVCKYLADLVGTTSLEDKADLGSDRDKLVAILDRYGIDKTIKDESGNDNPIFDDSTKVKYGGLQALRTYLKLENDKEDNALQRNSSTMQNMMSKRDSALQMLGKLQKKIDRTSKTITSAIGT